MVLKGRMERPDGLNGFLAERRPAIISIIPNLRDESGHDYSYNRSVGAAARRIGWDHKAVVPDDCKFEVLPENWSKAIMTGGMGPKGGVAGFSKIMTACRHSVSIYKYLKNETSARNVKTIIFMESFTTSTLAAFVIASLFLPRKAISVWVLYRCGTDQLPSGGKIYKTINKILCFLFGEEKVRLLTDSELLGRSLSVFFKKAVHVMPIPHTDSSLTDIEPGKHDELVCWWPGPPRPSKGLEIIRRIASLRTDEAKRLSLVMARSSKIVPGEGDVKVELIDDALPREEYLSRLRTSDVILLPYDPAVYREATSGIFVESVIAGKIPVVTRGTWMAWELSKYGLDDLAMDWAGTELITRILEIVKDRNIRDKLSRMRRGYQNFHTESRFAEKMMGLCEGGS